MLATAILPVKRFDAAKQRLADVLGPEQRARLAAAMVADVLAQLRACDLLERIIVVSGEREVAQLAAAAGAELLDDADDSGHSEAALRGVEAALQDGAAAVALLPGDCPLIEPAEVDAALATLAPPAVAVIPDRHGSGTNGLLLSPPDAIDPAFGPDSRERHMQLARRAGATAAVVELPSLALDLDTGDDLEALRQALSVPTWAGSRTAIALERIVARSGRAVS
jgi:2-phospho-L-lactate/phosphoenolpyruvate guanylyltransferase